VRLTASSLPQMMCTVGRARLLTITVFVFCYVLTASTPHEWVVTTTNSTNATTNVTTYTMKLDYSKVSATVVIATGNTRLCAELRGKLFVVN